MSAGLARLNGLFRDDAVNELLRCCGSKEWAHRVADQRPFAGVEDVLRASDAAWWSLSREDWLEAFRSHPKIGEQPAPAERWSREEQSGVRGASQETLDALREANQQYEKRFGYIFIVCASGKSSDEMLARLRQRLANDPETELRIAAEQQRQITQLRLRKLL